VEFIPSGEFHEEFSSPVDEQELTLEAAMARAIGVKWAKPGLPI
jgi:hypothetical protein